jgi:predicted Zn-dependent peptidase
MFEKTVLPNKLCIVTSTMPHTHSVSISFFVGAGLRYEPLEKAGISHFLEHLLFKGTEKRQTMMEISEAIEGVGGILNGGTGKEFTVYWVKVARPHFHLALDVLTDMLRRPKLDPVEMEKERQVILEEINESLDSPHQQVNMLIDKVVWPNQILGLDTAGSKETVSAITREMVFEYFKRQYVPSNIVVSVAGDISHDEVVAAISDVFAGDFSGNPAPWHPAKNSQEAPRFQLEKREIKQAHICLAVRGFPVDHPDRFKLDLLNVVLGGGMSSRLFLELRERRGLAYEIHSYTDCLLDSGVLIIYVGTEPQNADTVIEAILEELRWLKNEDVSEQELLRAKELTKGRLLLRMEDSRSVANWLGEQELLSEHIYTVDDIVSIIDAISSEDIKRVAENLFHSDKLNLAVVGSFQDGKEFKIPSL